MKLEKNMHILIVGLGLLGGSYAEGLTARGYRVDAITKEQSSVDFALEKGIVRTATTRVDPALVGAADVVVFALYPHVLLEWLEQYQTLLKPGAILTDVTGVKGCIVGRVQAMLRPDVEFIAAHPMAGREVCGVENSTAAMFRGANYIVVPTEQNTPAAIELCRDLGETLGFARVSELSVGMHDDMIAFLSQLTHCIAVSLMCCNNTPGLEDYTGDSFRDLTRIARINDEMWSELFLDNRPALLGEMERFRETFNQLYDRIAAGDREGIREMMRLSTQRRKRFDKQV